MGNTTLKDSDYYNDEFGNLVFTASYHKRRGYCCQSGCRHCPYDIDSKISESVPIELNLECKIDEVSIEEQAEFYLSEYEKKD